MKKISDTPSVGRPRSFDPDVALEKAMQVFWKKGYEGTSLTDLTEAMGINRPSLYAAFGNKEELFMKVLNRYGSGPTAYVQEALAEPTARAVIEKLLLTSASKLGNPDTPCGCLALQSVLCGSDEAANAQEATRNLRVCMQGKFRERFERAQAEGDLPATVNPDDLARYVAMILNGLSIQASNGATREEVQRTVGFILQTLPF